MSGSLRTWIESQKHLPRWLRDFHDQKDVFKSLHQWIGRPVRSTGAQHIEARVQRALAHDPDLLKSTLATMEISWVDGHCYLTDYVLPFLAAHGYTLQKSRSRRDFASLHETIAERKADEVKVLRAYMDQRTKEHSSTPRAAHG